MGAGHLLGAILSRMHLLTCMDDLRVTGPLPSAAEECRCACAQGNSFHGCVARSSAVKMVFHMCTPSALPRATHPHVEFAREIQRRRLS